MEVLKKIFFLIFFALLLGCGEVPPQEDFVLADSIVSIGSDDAALREQIMQERILKGDTLTKSIHELIDLLPAGFKGYLLEDTSGQNIEFDNRRMTEANSTWSKEEQDLKISLIDYNRNLQTWNGLCDMYRTNYVQDNEEELSLAWKAGLGENFGWILQLKGEQHIRVILGFSYRYLITAELNGVSDTSIVRTLMSEADWSALRN